MNITRALPFVFVATILTGCGGGGGGAFTVGTTTVATSTSPSVTSLSPASSTASSGTTVTITGVNLTGATKVTFGGIAATSFTPVSATSITAVQPAGVGIVDVQVTTSNGTSSASAADSFTYQISGHTMLLTGSIGTSGTSAGQLKTPNGAAVALDGTVYVVDSGNSRVDIYTGTGTFQRNFSIGSSNVTNVWDGISVSSGGNVYVTNAATNQLFEYSNIGTLLQTLTLPTGAIPHAVSVLETGDVLVDAVGINKILEYSPALSLIGVFPNSFGAAGVNTDSLGFVLLSNVTSERLSVAGVVQATYPQPSGGFSTEIAADSSGDIFAGYDSSNEILKLSPAGAILDSIPVVPATGDRTIAAGPAGQLYVPDQTNCRIDIYTAN